MNWMLLSCKEATLLIEKEQIEPLTKLEKTRLWVHTSMCRACNAYQKQSLLIAKALKKWFHLAPANSRKLPSSSKEKIIDKIKSS